MHVADSRRSARPVRIPSIATMIPRNWKRFVQAGMLAATGLGAYMYVSAPTSVNVAPVIAAATTETLGATGTVRGDKVADLGLDMTGVVQGIYVNNGDRVGAGSLLLSLRSNELDSRVQQAQASVNSAQAELARASRPPMGSEVQQAEAELAQARLVGDARVAEAQARLSDLKAGTATEEIAEAKAELDSRKDLLTKARTDLDRTALLVKEGALSQSSLDQAKTTVETSLSAVTAQQERVRLLESGARPQQISEAKAAVAEAAASRDTSVRAAREKLNTLLAMPRHEDVAAAQAKVEEARTQLVSALDERQKAELRAPFDGVVADLAVEQGQSVSPGFKLMVLHQFTKPIIEVETDEDNLRTLSIGQKAIVSSDSFPGKTFEAVLTDLGSKIDSDRGTMQIKLRRKEGYRGCGPT